MFFIHSKVKKIHSKKLKIKDFAGGLLSEEHLRLFNFSSSHYYHYKACVNVSEKNISQAEHDFILKESHIQANIGSLIQNVCEDGCAVR